MSLGCLLNHRQYAIKMEYEVTLGIVKLKAA